MSVELEQQKEQIAHLEQTVSDMEEIQHTQMEITELKERKTDDRLEVITHKLHTLSNQYMAMEEKLNEVAEFASHMRQALDDLRQSLKSFSD